MNIRKKAIRVVADKQHLHVVEGFVESICDGYNIMNSYFGNIMFAVTQTFLFAIENGGDSTPAYIDISFHSQAKGLVFTISLGDHFLEIAALLQKSVDDELQSENHDNKNQDLLIIRMLCDEIKLDDAKNSLTLVFYISSINEHLTADRLRDLEAYYQKLLQKKLV
jgi:hypothetical protein